MDQLTGWLGWSSRHKCPISLVDSIFSKLLAESARRFRSSSQHDDARDKSIESADNAQEYIARFLVFPFEILFGVRYQALFVFRGSLRDDPRRLIHDQQMVIFEQDAAWKWRGIHLIIIHAIRATQHPLE